MPEFTGNPESDADRLLIAAQDWASRRARVATSQSPRDKISTKCRPENQEAHRVLQV